MEKKLLLQLLDSDDSDDEYSSQVRNVVLSCGYKLFENRLRKKTRESKKERKKNMTSNSEFEGI